MSHDSFYEWLLSDNPAARAERQSRRTVHYQRERDNATHVRAWADKINATPDASLNLRDMARTMRPYADRTLARVADAEAESDEAYVARVRAEHEMFMQADEPGYRYPEYLTGPEAADYPRPLEPEAEL